MMAKDQRISVGKVEITVKRIFIELLNVDHPARPVRIEFEACETSLVAAVSDYGVDGSVDGDAVAFSSPPQALASLYKLAGVDLVCEQVQANLPTQSATWNVTADCLVVCPDPPERMRELSPA